MLQETFTITDEVQIFPQQGGWYYIPLSQSYTDLTADYAERGLVAITATIGTTSWNTSLMPKGDGTLFIPLSAKIRKCESIQLGDMITLSFTLRQR